MRGRRWLAVVLSVLLVGALLSACGGSGNGGSGDSSGSGTMTVMLDEQPAEGNAMVGALDKWSEETGNAYEIVVIPYDDQLTSFRSMVQNNDAPDLIATTRLTALYPEEFTDLSQEIDIDMFDRNIIMIISNDYVLDQVLCLPLQYTVSNWYYNKDAFAQAGLEAPTADAPWTLDELYENAATLAESGGVQFGLAVDYSRARYDNLMYSNGGSLVEKAGDSYVVTANSPENIATLERFIEENDAGTLPKVVWTGGSNDNPADMFQNGSIGILLSGSWNYTSFTNNISGFEWGPMATPTGSESQSTILGGSGLAVPNTASDAATAIEFLKWFYGDEQNYFDYLYADNGLPFMVDKEYTNPDPKIAADFQLLQDSVQYVTDAFMTDEESSWRNFLDNEYRDLLRQAVNGEMSAEDALTNFSSQLSERSDWEMKYE